MLVLACEGRGVWKMEDEIAAMELGCPAAGHARHTVEDAVMRRAFVKP